MKDKERSMYWPRLEETEESWQITTIWNSRKDPGPEKGH